MALEALKQGLVIPLVDFTPEHFSSLEDSLRAAPGFDTDPEATTKMLTRLDAINMSVMLRRELMAVEKYGRSSGRGVTHAVGDFESFLQEKFIEAPWPAEVATAPARIVASKRAQAQGAGILTVAECQPLTDTRKSIQEALAEFYDLPSLPERLFHDWFVPGVQVAFARGPRELGYLRHLEGAINDPKHSILPAIFEPGEQLKLR